MENEDFIEVSAAWTGQLYPARLEARISPVKPRARVGSVEGHVVEIPDRETPAVLGGEPQLPAGPNPKVAARVGDRTQAGFIALGKPAGLSVRLQALG